MNAHWTRVHSCLFAAVSFCAALNAASIRYEDGAFTVADWSPSGDFPSIFTVHVGSSDTPMLGDYSVQNGQLSFRPRFPLTAGGKYRAVFRAPGAAPIETIFDGPKREAGPATIVEKIYPT